MLRTFAYKEEDCMKRRMGKAQGWWEMGWNLCLLSLGYKRGKLSELELPLACSLGQLEVLTYHYLYRQESLFSSLVPSTEVCITRLNRNGALVLN